MVSSDDDARARTRIVSADFAVKPCRSRCRTGDKDTHVGLLLIDWVVLPWRGYFQVHFIHRASTEIKTEKYGLNVRAF